MDGRDTDFSTAERWVDEKVLGKGRARFILPPHTRSQPNEQGALSIQKITPQDEAEYRCRVDFKYAQTRNSRVKLAVIVPPDRIVIQDSDGNQRTTVIGPYYEGYNLSLLCIVYGGKPTPVVRWLKNGVVTNERRPSKDENMNPVSTPLIWGPIMRTDLHAEFTCAAYNTDRRTPLSSTVQLDLNLDPVNVFIVDRVEEPLTAGRRYEIQCSSSGSRPPARITWWNGDHRLHTTKETVSTDGNTTSSTLTFVPSRTDMGSYLSCRAENPALSEIYTGRTPVVLKTGWKLQILYSPEVRVVLGRTLRADSIREGMDVYFDCVVDALPPAYKVVWKKNGEKLQANVSIGVIISNRSLVLQSVSRITSPGNYSCTASNSEGDGHSLPFYLNVLYAPICKTNITKIYGVAKLETAKLICEVDSNGGRLNFSWSFNNSVAMRPSPLPRSEYSSPSSGTAISVLTYRPVSDTDFGTLYCNAANEVGSQSVPCVFQIISAGKPDTVVNCTSGSVSMTGFAVRCDPGFNGGLQQYFEMVVSDNVDGQAIDSAVVNITSGPLFIVSGLEANTKYRLAIYSFNQKGRSKPYVMRESTLGNPLLQKTKMKEIPPEEQRANYHIATGIGVAVVGALLLMACIIISLRATCFPKKQSPEKEEEESLPPVQPHDSPLSGDKDFHPDIIAETLLNDGQFAGRNLEQICALEDTRWRIQPLLVDCAAVECHQNVKPPPSTSCGLMNIKTPFPSYCTIRRPNSAQKADTNITVGSISNHSNINLHCSPRQGVQLWPVSIAVPSYGGVSVAGVRSRLCAGGTLPHRTRIPCLSPCLIQTYEENKESSM